MVLIIIENLFPQQPIRQSLLFYTAAAHLDSRSPEYCTIQIRDARRTA